MLGVAYPGYGFIAEDIPEVSITVVAQRRGEGLGDRLLRELENEARQRGDQAHPVLQLRFRGRSWSGKGAAAMVTSYLLVEGIRVGARLEGLPLRLLKIERYRMPSAMPEQPSVWTTVEFEFEEADAEQVAAALSEVVSEEGGWYTNFTLDDEVFVIFAGRIFRYHRGESGIDRLLGCAHELWANPYHEP